MPERRGRTESLTFARLVRVSENRSALAAVQQLAASAGPAGMHTGGHCPDLLFLHGPPGTGKTHLVRAMVDDACRRSRGLSVDVVAAGDWSTMAPLDAEPDLLVVEDLQHLQAGSADALTRTLDSRLAHQRPTVLTATAGPRYLTSLPERLRSRLTAGLVVAVEPLAEASRLAILCDKAQLRQLAIRADALAALAKRLSSSGRALDASLDRLAELSRTRPCPLETADVVQHFAELICEPSVERIATQVCRYFQVDTRQMLSRRRYRNILLPRQVGMYLARQLTGLSFAAIGEYFGGRDHSTVLHACRKVEVAMAHDAVLSGAVQRLQGELG